MMYQRYETPASCRPLPEFSLNLRTNYEHGTTQLDSTAIRRSSANIGEFSNGSELFADFTGSRGDESSH